MIVQGLQVAQVVNHHMIYGLNPVILIFYRPAPLVLMTLMMDIVGFVIYHVRHATSRDPTIAYHVSQGNI